MPKRARATSRRARRPFKRPKRRNGYKATAKRQGVRRARLAPVHGIPQKSIVQLNFFYIDALAAATTAEIAEPSLAVFNINSLNDPTGALAADQPHYFDQWGVFFRKYRVLACKWMIQAYVDGSTNALTDRYLTAIVVDDQSTTSGLANFNKVQEVLESKRMRKKSMRIKNGLSSPHTVLSGYARMQDYITSRDPADLGALFAADPANLVRLNIGYANAFGGAAMTAGTIKYKLRLTFTAMLYEPKFIGQS